MKFADAEQRTAAAESTKQTADQQLAATQAALESSNNKIAELEAIVASRDDEAADLVSVRAENEALEEKLRTTSAQLAETVADVDKLNEECLQLRESETNRNSSVDEMLRELRDDLDAKQQQLSAAEDEKQSIAGQLEQVQQQLRDSSDKYSGLTDAHATLQSDFASVNEAFDRLKQDNLCSNDHTAAVVEECTALKTAVDNLTVQHNAALAEKQAACEEMDGLRESLSDSVEKCEKLQRRENMLCGGVAELSRAVLASPTDDTSLMSLSDHDIQSLVAQMLSEVADLWRNLELQVKQVEDERQLREKVEHEKVLLLQAGDTTHASVQSLQEANQQLSSTISQLESSQTELSERCGAYESQVMQLQTELEAARTSLNAAVESSGDLTSLQKSVDVKDAEIERLREEIRAYKLDIERLEQEREVDTVSQQPLQASVLCPEDIRNDESQCSEFGDSVQVQQHDDANESYDRSVTSENQPSGANVERPNDDGHAGIDELSEMKEKMAEWEAMMSMLQTEKDEIQLELQTLELQEQRIFGTVDEVLQSILNTMKGRDLFPLSSEVDDGSSSELWSKLALLKTVVDELLFEIDEMKEKIHHMSDEVKGLEQRVSESEVKNESIKEEAKEKTLQLQSLRESEDALKKRELELCTEIERLKSCASDTANDIRDKDALAEKLQVLVSDADKMNAEIELLRTEAASKDQLLNDAKASEEMMQQTLNEAKEQLHNSQLHLSSVESEYSAKLAELQTERDQLFARVSELQTDSDVMKQQSADVTDDLQRKYDDKCSEASRLQDSVTSYCKETEELKEQMKVEVLEKEKLKSEHTQLAGALEELELHLDHLRTETDNLSAAKITLEQKLGSLQAESEEKVKLGESQISQLEVSLSTIQADYKTTCERKLAAETELSDCSQKLDVTNARLLQAEDRCSGQAAELLQVRSEVERLKEECRVREVQKSASCESVESVQKLSSGVGVETTVDSSTVQVYTFVLQTAVYATCS